MLIRGMSSQYTVPNFSPEILSSSSGGSLLAPRVPPFNPANTQLRIAGMRAIGDIVREVSKGIVSALKLLDTVIKEPKKNVTKAPDEQNTKTQVAKNYTGDADQKFKVDVS
jgi:hypothetical protein